MDAPLQVLSADQLAPRDPALAPYFEPKQRAFGDTAYAALLGHSIPVAAPARPYHTNSTLGEVKSTLLGKMLYRMILHSMKKMAPAGGDEKMERIISAMLEEMPLRNLVMFSEGRFSPQGLQLCIQLMNGQYRSALKALVKGRRR